MKHNLQIKHVSLKVIKKNLITVCKEYDEKMVINRTRFHLADLLACNSHLLLIPFREENISRVMKMHFS